MSNMPAWYDQLRWSDPAVPFLEFVSGSRDMETIAAGAGLYVFCADPGPVAPGTVFHREPAGGSNRSRVLYVGKADGGRQTLRSRVRAYVRRLRRPSGPASKHEGLEMLCRHYAANPHALYLRWCGCILTRDVEGGLIDLLDPQFNNKSERVGLSDDELIPEIYLYDV